MTVYHVVLTAHADVLWLDCVSGLVDELIGPYEKHKNDVRPGRFLPDDFKEVFCRHDLCLVSISGAYIDDLRAYLFAALSLRSRWS